MGAAKWVRDAGPGAGKIVEIDAVSQCYDDIARLPLYRRRLCSDLSQASLVASACEEVLDTCKDKCFRGPKTLSPDTLLRSWKKLLFELWCCKG